MNAESPYEHAASLADGEAWLAFATGALLLLVGASHRSVVGACLAVSSAPLLYRGITGRCPNALNGHGQPDSTRAALGSERGAHVRESVRLERAMAPARKAGALIASLFGREPSHTIRRHLRHFRQLLEAGEIPR
jgi:uncharacterized membrane protein